jgi:hypothetical protein
MESSSQPKLLAVYAGAKIVACIHANKPVNLGEFSREHLELLEPTFERLSLSQLKEAPYYAEALLRIRAYLREQNVSSSTAV